MYAVMVGIAAAVVLCVSLDFKPPAKSLIKDIKVVLKNVELDVFFLVHFMSGKCKLGPHYDQHTLMYLPSKFHPIPTIGWIFVEFYWPSSWGFWQVRGWAEFRIQFPPTGIDSSLPLVNKLNARRCFNFQKKKKNSFAYANKFVFVWLKRDSPSDIWIRFVYHRSAFIDQFNLPLRCSFAYGKISVWGGHCDCQNDVTPVRSRAAGGPRLLTSLTDVFLPAVAVCVINGL